MAKNLLNEGTVRRWAHLAKTAPLMENFIEERSEQFNEEADVQEEGADDTLEEDNFDKTGRGPHREGAGKNGEQQGIASNQGKEPKSTPDGKLEIPGTGYAGDHKNKSKSPEKGSTDGGTQLQGKGTVTENLGEPDMDDEMGGDMPPAPPMGDEGGMEGEVDLEGLVQAIAQAITTSTGVEVSVAGHAEPDGDELGGGMPPMGGEEPPMDAAPPAEMPMGDEGGEDYEEEEEVVENKYNLSEVDDASFQQEAQRRGYAMQEGAYKKDDEMKQESQEAVVESIARKVAAKLTAKTAPKKRRVAKKRK